MRRPSVVSVRTLSKVGRALADSAIRSGRQCSPQRGAGTRMGGGHYGTSIESRRGVLDLEAQLRCSRDSQRHHPPAVMVSEIGNLRSYSP